MFINLTPPHLPPPPTTAFFPPRTTKVPTFLITSKPDKKYLRLPLLGPGPVAKEKSRNPPFSPFPLLSPAQNSKERSSSDLFIFLGRNGGGGRKNYRNSFQTCCLHTPAPFFPPPNPPLPPHLKIDSQLHTLSPFPPFPSSVPPRRPGVLPNHHSPQVSSSDLTELLKKTAPPSFMISQFFSPLHPLSLL